MKRVELVPLKLAATGEPPGLQPYNQYALDEKDPLVVDEDEPEEIVKVTRVPNYFYNRAFFCCRLTKAAFIIYSNIFCCIWHATLAIVSVAAATQNGRGMDTPRLTLYVTNLTWVPNATNSLVPVNQPVDGLYLSHMTMWFFLLSFLAHLTIVAGNWSQGLWGGEGKDSPYREITEGWFPTGWYFRWLHECRQPLRWVEYSFSASLMAITISVASGVNHAYMITFIFTLMWCTMVFGYYTEIISRPKMRGVLKPLRWKISWRRPETLLFPGLAAAIGTDKLERLAPHFLGYVPYITVWAVLFHSFFYNVGDAEQGPPDFVYIIVVGQLVVFTGFGFTQLFNQGFNNGPSWYYWGEWSYLFLSLFSKGLLGLTLVANVFLYDSFDEAVANAD